MVRKLLFTLLTFPCTVISEIVRNLFIEFINPGASKLIFSEIGPERVVPVIATTNGLVKSTLLVEILTLIVRPTVEVEGCSGTNGSLVKELLITVLLLLF